MADGTYTPNPNKLAVSLRFDSPTHGTFEVQDWTEYEFASSFTTPADGFHFTLGVAKIEDIPSELLDFDYRSKVQLVVDGKIQASGYIDAVHVNATRNGGIEFRIDGRDTIGQAVDAGMDPTIQFKENQSLGDMLKAVFEPYGFTKISIDPDDNRALITGEERLKRSRTLPKAPTGRRKKRNRKSKRASNFGKPTADIKEHLLRAKDREGAFAFASRVSQRHGLWLWGGADGETLIVGQPTFDQPPAYSLFRTIREGTNMLSCSVTTRVDHQPTCVVADGFSKGGEFGRSGWRVIIENPAVETDSPYEDAILARYDKIPILMPPYDETVAKTILVPHSKIIYLHDNASNSEENLEHFALRELAILRKTSLTVSVEVEGHGQVVGGKFIPWNVDTVVDFVDEVSGVKEPLYVFSRTFRRSRAAGTTTQLELIRLWSLSFEGNGQ